MQLVALAIDRFAFALVAPILALFAVGALAAVVTSVFAVRPLIDLARDRKTRVVHGLEHATLAVLKQRGIEHHGGVTTNGRFCVEIENGGSVTMLVLREATTEAIRRVSRGETSLAYSRKCGTSLLVALLAVSLAIVGGGVTGLALGLPMNVVAGLVAIAILLAWLLAQPLGLLAQRVVTVSTQFREAQVMDVVREVSASGDRARFSVAVAVDAYSNES